MLPPRPSSGTASATPRSPDTLGTVGVALARKGRCRLTDDLVRRSLLSDLEETVQVVYVSPLRRSRTTSRRTSGAALGDRAGVGGPESSGGRDPHPGAGLVHPASVRAAMVKRPPHILDNCRQGVCGTGEKGVG